MKYDLKEILIAYEMQDNYCTKGDYKNDADRILRVLAEVKVEKFIKESLKTYPKYNGKEKIQS